MAAARRGPRGERELHRGCTVVNTFMWRDDMILTGE